MIRIVAKTNMFYMFSYQGQRNRDSPTLQGKGGFEYFNRELWMIFEFLNTYFKIHIPVNGLPPVDNVNFVPDLISSSTIFFLRIFEESCSALSGP